MATLTAMLGSALGAAACAPAPRPHAPPPPAEQAGEPQWQWRLDTTAAQSLALRPSWSAEAYAPPMLSWDRPRWWRHLSFGFEPARTWSQESDSTTATCRLPPTYRPVRFWRSGGPPLGGRSCKHCDGTHVLPLWALERGEVMGVSLKSAADEDPDAFAAAWEGTFEGRLPFTLAPVTPEHSEAVRCSFVPREQLRRALDIEADMIRYHRTTRREDTARALNPTDAMGHYCSYLLDFARLVGWAEPAFQPLRANCEADAERFYASLPQRFAQAWAEAPPAPASLLERADCDPSRRWPGHRSPLRRVLETVLTAGLALNPSSRPVPGRCLLVFRGAQAEREQAYVVSEARTTVVFKRELPAGRTAYGVEGPAVLGAVDLPAEARFERRRLLRLGKEHHRLPALGLPSSATAPSDDAVGPARQP